jgi:O-antigen ligase
LREAPAIAPFLAFAAIALVSVSVAPSPGAALTEWLRFASILVTYGVVYLAARAPGGVRRVAVAVLLSAAVPVAVGLLQFSQGGSREIADFGRATGTFLHPDPYGIYLGMLVPFALALALARRIEWRWLVLAGVPLAAAALVGSYTRTGWALAVLGVLVLGVVRHRGLLALAPVALAAIVVAAPSTVERLEDVRDPAEVGRRPANSLQSRVDLWRENLPKARRNPVVGTGLHAIVEESPDEAHVHSDFVRALVETGVFGLAAYVWLLAAAVAGCWRGLRRAADAAGEAVARGALAAAACFVLASTDSNLMTQVAVSGTAWTIIAVGHAAGPWASAGRVNARRRAATGSAGTHRRPSSAAS